MPFEKGHKKATGRPKGVPNKATTESRELLNGIISGQIKNIEKSLEATRKDDDYKYLTIMERLIGYVFPKKKDITSDDKAIQVAPITGVRIIEDGSESQPTAETDQGS